MAQRYLTEEEQKELKQIARIYIKENLSLKEFLRRHPEIKMSSVTLAEKFKENCLGFVDKNLYKEIRTMLEKRNPNGQKKKLEIAKRIILETKLLLEEDKTCQEIVEVLKTKGYEEISISTVSRDLSERINDIELLDEETKQKVKSTLQQHSINNSPKVGAR